MKYAIVLVGAGLWMVLACSFYRIGEFDFGLVQLVDSSENLDVAVCPFAERKATLGRK